MRPSLRLLLVVTAVTALAGACGGEGDSKSAKEVLAAAPGKTLAERTSRVAIDVALGGGGGGRFQGGGEFDFEKQQGRLTLDLGPLGLPGVGPTEVVFNEKLLFMKLDLNVPKLRQRPWLRIDMDALGKGAGPQLEGFRQLQSNDPTAALHYLRGVTDEVKKLGTETVRGTKTTRYSATLDLGKAGQEVREDLKDDIAQIQAQLGTSTIPTEAWIDDEGRLRRLRYSVDLSKATPPNQAADAGTGTVTASFELYDFGVGVDAAAPPADQITDISELVGNVPSRPRR